MGGQGLGAAGPSPALSTLVEHLAEGVVVEDAVGRVRQVNEAFCRILGLSQGPGALQGEPFHALAEEVRRSLGDGGDEPTWRLDGLLRLIDGRAVHSRLLAVPGGGRLWLVQELADPERIPQRGRESEANLVALLESSEDMLWSVDRALRLVVFNRAFADKMRRAHGSDPQVGGSALSLLPPADRVHWEALYRRALSGDRLAAEDAFPDADGVRTYEMSLNPIVAEGAVTGVAVLSRDVTQRRRHAEAMRQAMEAAEAANRAKSDFLANMSHEIRTPLNAIIGMGELALSTELSGTQREYLSTVRSNSEALLNLINDILDFSKIEAGQMGVEVETLRLPELVEEVVIGLGERAFARDLDLRLDIDPAVPSALLGDGRHLRQVLTNLLSNAIKYTARGWVEVRLALDERSAPGPALVRLEVEDTGPGIAPEDHERVFHKFFRSSGERSSGTGLGLSITRSLVELMGGRISLRSEPGRGATFTMRLPMPSAPGDDGHEAALRRMVGGRRVALVSPCEVLRASLARTLTSRGVGVREAPDAAALEVLGDALDALVIDSRVGAEAVAAIAARAPTLPGGPSLILLTPLGSPEGALPLTAQVAARLHRPVRRQHLFEAIAGLRREPVGGVVSATPAPAPGGRRILLVEDNADNQAVATATLKRGGHVVELAEDGVEAVRMAASGRYDLILMDIHMPRMDGVEATRRVRAREAEEGRPRVPIVALTAHATQDFRDRCLQAGADAFLTKPIVPLRLLNTIEELARREHVVLVVDDVESNRQLLGHFLTSVPGYRPIFASHGREALDLAEGNEAISLVLLDMEMPVLDGRATALALRALPGWSEVPIVAVSGHAGPEDRRRSLEAGCVEHVVKPVRRAQLLELVGRLLGPAPDQETASTVILTDPPPDEAGGRLRVQVDAVHQDALPRFLDDVRRELKLIRGHLIAGRFAELATLSSKRREQCRALGISELMRAFLEIQRAAQREDAARVRRAAMSLLNLLEELDVEWV